MTLATKVTLLRIIFVPFLLLSVKYAQTEMHAWLNILFFLGLSLTDYLDGFIARARNEVTDVGKFLDPLADKVLILSMFILFIELGTISAFPVIIIVFRELLIVGFRSLASLKDVIIKADLLGKVKTVFQMVTVVYIMLALPYSEFIVWGMVLITVMSGINYLWQNRQVFK
jgi:CDP-diacylglycerol---glycerol-3-phosphate 3-phosphatidyltransferase